MSERASGTPSSIAPGVIPGLTTLRGLLATWVVVYHYWGDVLRLVPQAHSFTPLAQSGNMAVPGFFMLSGLVLMHTYAARMSVFSWKEAGTFLVMRLVRVYPVHFVTLIAVACMVVVSQFAGVSLDRSGYSGRDLLLNLALLHTWVPHFQLNWNYPSWSISSEWFAYCAFPFFVPIAMRLRANRGTVLACALLSLGTSIVFMLTWRRLPFYELLLVIPTFAAGAWLFVLDQEMPNTPRTATAAAPSFGAALCATACYLPMASGRIAAILSGLMFTVAALYRGRRLTHPAWANRAMVGLGEVSYSLYMTHTLVQKVMTVCLPAARFSSAGLLVRVAVLFAYAGAIALACALSYRLVEVPSRSMLRAYAVSRLARSTQISRQMGI